MRIHVVKHETFEGPGAIVAWAAERGHGVAVTELALGQALPSLEDLDALVVMGGPMSVNEEGRYPWLGPEKRLLREAMEGGKKVLGVCLGAQMIASALGAPVTRNAEKEIGWFPVEATPEGKAHPFYRGLPDSWMAFHWHGETYGLPAGAVRLLRSAACEQQAFAIGTQVLALQCHPEVDAGTLEEMLSNGRDELDASRAFIQDEAVIRGQHQALLRLGPLLRRLLDQWAV